MELQLSYILRRLVVAQSQTELSCSCSSRARAAVLGRISHVIQPTVVILLDVRACGRLLARLLVQSAMLGQRVLGVLIT